MDCLKCTTTSGQDGFQNLLPSKENCNKKSQSTFSFSPPKDHVTSWSRGPFLGSGAFGAVTLGLQPDTGLIFAVKSVEADRSPGQLLALENEIQMLQSIKSPRVVKYLGSDWSFEEGVRKRNLLLEHLPGGSISDLMKNFGHGTGGLREPLIRRYTQGILLALQDLHQVDIIHCDVKGKNVLVSNTGEIKLCDLGAAERLQSVSDSSSTAQNPSSLPQTLAAKAMLLSQTASRSGTKPLQQSGCPGGTHVPRGGSPGFGPSTSKLRGTICWMAPEVIQTSIQTKMADVWSVGCTVIEMATGRPPWGPQVTDAYSALYRIGFTDALPELPPKLSPEGHDFLQKCLQRDPAKRLSVEELLEHPFVNSAWGPSPSVVAAREAGTSGDSDSPTSVLLGEDWGDDVKERQGRAEESGKNVGGKLGGVGSLSSPPPRKHRRSMSDAIPSMTTFQNLVDKDKAVKDEGEKGIDVLQGFAALSRLVEASGGGRKAVAEVSREVSTTSPRRQVSWKPQITLEIPGHPEEGEGDLFGQTNEDVPAGARGSSWWSSPGSPTAAPGNWLVVHSPGSPRQVPANEALPLGIPRGEEEGGFCDSSRESTMDGGDEGLGHSEFLRPASVQNNYMESTFNPAAAEVRLVPPSSEDGSVVYRGESVSSSWSLNHALTFSQDNWANLQEDGFSIGSVKEDEAEGETLELEEASS